MRLEYKGLGRGHGDREKNPRFSASLSAEIRVFNQS
jgi:hypothetical protein